MTDEDKRIAFMRELTALSRKHGIAIEGCGCCGSPSLVEIDATDPGAGYLWNVSTICEVEWTQPGEYHWEEHKHKVLK